MLPDGDERIRAAMQSSSKWFDGKPTYQFHKWRAAYRYVKKPRTRHAVDIGAHVGLWSRVLVKHFMRVTAFEPIAEYRNCFAHNVLADYPKVVLHPYALGMETKDVELKLKTKNSGVTHIVPDKGPDTETASMRTLDSFALTDVDFLKIDCEGYEWAVVRGGEATIRRDRPVIIVEQKPDGIARYDQAGEPRAVMLLQEWGAQVMATISGDYILCWK